MKCIPFCSVYAAYLIQAKCVFHASKSPTVPIFGKERIPFRCCWILIDECFHDFVRFMIVLLCKIVISD